MAVPLILTPNILTCFIAVTVMTKKSGSPLVTGLVGVSIINWKTKNCHSGFAEDDLIN